MSFIKKILVLKQVSSEFSLNAKPISGIARIEIDSGVADLHLSLINFATCTHGEFFAFLIDSDKKLYEFKLGVRPSSFFAVIDSPINLSSGFAVGICLINSNLPTTALFAKEDGFNFSVTDFKRAVAEKCLESRKIFKRIEDAPEIKEPIKTPPKPQISQPRLTPSEEFSSPDKEVKYNDEAVATENYFEIDDKIHEKLSKIKEVNDGWLRLENELPTDRSQEKTHQSAKNDDCAKNETDANDGKNDNQPERFFDTVRKELNDVFFKYPKEENLSKTFPNGKFVRINYSPAKYYVVGLIKEENKEKYLCYGVPAVYSPEPPKELKGYCQFIPNSIFDFTGEGYWLMFQDARTGERVKMK